MSVTALVACAGKSQRMGQTKALLRLGDKSFVRHITDTLREAGVSDIVVTLPECNDTAQRICAELSQLQVRMIRNLFPKRELLGSAQSALCHSVLDTESRAQQWIQHKRRNHEKTYHAWSTWLNVVKKSVFYPRLRVCARSDKDNQTALLITPVDMPFASSALIRRIMHAHTETSIVIATHNQTPAHPILIGKSYFPEILSYGNNDSLRTLLSHHAQRIITIEDEDPRLLLNINTPEDYARLTKPSLRNFDAAAIDAPGAKSL